MNDKSLIDRLLVNQELSWERGDALPVESLLENARVENITPGEIVELICNERRLRSEYPAIDIDFQWREYRKRFPALMHAVDQQFSCEKFLLAIENPTDSDLDETTSRQRTADYDIPELPNFHQLELLGTGGFGRVFKASQIVPERQVAIKIPRSDLDFPMEIAGSLRHEANRVAKLRHPNIIEIYEVGTFNGLPFLVMPLVDCGHLGQRIAAYSGCLRDCVELVLSLALAVGHAHSLGILHCDIKPDNILIDHGGRALLTDFGLAVVLREGFIEAALGGVGIDSGTRRATDDFLSFRFGIGGSPAYMAPEQHSSALADLSTRTDIYGLGAVLFHLLTGRPPPGKDRENDRRMPDAWQDALACLSVPSDLSAICRKCLSHQPEHRYQSARELAADLESFLAGREVKAQGLRGFRRIADKVMKWCRREPWGALSALTAVAGIAVTSLVLIWSAQRLTHKSRELATALDDAATTSFELGKLTAERGSKEDAIAAYIRALALFSSLAEKHPEHWLFSLQLAKTQSNLGCVYRDIGQREIAESILRQSIVRFERLLANQADDPDTLEGLANAHSNLGNLLVERGEFALAESAYKKSQEFRRQLITAFPQDMRLKLELAKSAIDFGHLLEMAGDKPELAIKVLKQAIQELDSIAGREIAGLGTTSTVTAVSKVDLPEVLERRQNALMFLAMVTERIGRSAEADSLFTAAIQAAQHGVDTDPHDCRKRVQLALAHSNRGTWLVETGRLGEGVADLERARQEFEHLERLGFRTATTRGFHGVCLSNLGNSYTATANRATIAEDDTQRRQRASDAARLAIDLLREWSRADPKAIHPRNIEASTLRTLGDISFVDGNTKKAGMYYEQAIEVLNSISIPTYEVMLNKMVTFNNAGRVHLDSQPADLETAVRYHGEQAIKAGNRQEETARILAEAYARRATMRELGKNLNAAIDDWRVAISRLNPSHASHLQCLVGYAVTLARSGDHRLAAQVLSSIPVDSRSVDNVAFNVACAYSMMRSATMPPMPTPTQPMESLRVAYLAKAMEWLERANVIGTFSSSEKVDQLLADIDLDGIRETPEFQAFAKRMLRDSRRAIHD